MLVLWAPPPPREMNGRLKEYTVFYRPLREWEGEKTSKGRRRRRLLCLHARQRSLSPRKRMRVRPCQGIRAEEKEILLTLL